MLKICLVIPSLESGGMERVMSELASFFSKKNNVEVHLVLYGKSREIFFPVPDRVNIYKPSFVFTDYKRFTATIKTFLFLRKIVKRIKPDTILSFGECWNSFVLLALLGLGFPTYISDRCQPDRSFSMFHKIMRKLLYPKATGVIAQTTLAKEITRKQKLHNNIKVIGNPIYQIPSNGKQEKENIVLSVGRLIESKHHDRLIKIFKNTCMKGWKLVIVGGDALNQAGMKRLRKVIEKNNMQESVELTGTVSNIESYYHRSKIFAFTSSSEGFPNVIGEAMSAGLPVISYDCVAGPSELIENNKTGFLISLFDDNEYGEKLMNLMNNESLRYSMGESSRERIKIFDIENIAEDFYSFITNN